MGPFGLRRDFDSPYDAVALVFETIPMLPTRVGCITLSVYNVFVVPSTVTFTVLFIVLPVVVWEEAETALLDYYLY